MTSPSPVSPYRGNQALRKPFSSEVHAAPARHHDEYAGFSIDIPRGWKYINDGFGHNYAPARDAFSVYPDHQDNFGKRSLFSILIETNQDLSAREWAAYTYDSLGPEDSRSESKLRVAGRSAYEVRRSGRCDDCAGRYIRWDVFVQWDRESAIRFYLVSYRGGDFEARSHRFEQIYNSLRRASRDRFADDMRRFLRARRDEGAAERFLTERMAAHYESHGNLYQSDGCEDIDGYRVLSVLHDRDLGTLYEVDVGDLEILRIQGSPEGLALVVDYALFQECGTS